MQTRFTQHKLFSQLQTTLLKASVLLLCSSTFLYTTAEAMGTGAWVGVSPTFKLTEDSSVNIQSEFRIQNSVEQTLYRTSWLYRMAPHYTLGSGFDVFSGSNYETRIWQEVNYRKSMDTVTPFLRVREEVRRAQGMDDTRFRTRAMAGVTYSATPEAMLAYTLYDEFFTLQTTFDGPLSYYDRNWVGARVSIHSKVGVVHLGAMLETVNQGDSSIIGQLSYAAKFK